jgi:hypothetical protein
LFCNLISTNASDFYKISKKDKEQAAYPAKGVARGNVRGLFNLDHQICIASSAI